MRFTYEVDGKNEIRVWDNENPNPDNAPFCYQPWWPSEKIPFETKEQATAWVELYIEALSNPDSEFLPGDSPEEPKKLRLPPEPEPDPALDPEA